MMREEWHLPLFLWTFLASRVKKDNLHINKEDKQVIKEEID